MNRHQDKHTTLPFPTARRFLVDTCELGSQKHLIHGLLEIDVTDTRRRLRQCRDKDRETPSFTGFVINCVARAVDENKIMHAYRGSRDRLILFDDVDVTTIVEVEAGGHKVPLGHIIRAANKRTLWQIHDEIRSVQSAGGSKADSSLAGWRQRLMLSLPAFLRRAFYRADIKRPQGMKKRAGTVLVTAVGMFGQGTGWGIPLSLHTLTVTLGGIVERPGVVAGEIKIREYLSVTVSFDHDIIDGAPAARFAQRLQTLVESGYGLDEEEMLDEEVSNA
jgi:pyruvate/2-oxoglutarate dehydrogenase complex dihydrolipoamide acyltransferase (E2) component